eukprot:m.222635 g.222635  ORF g.222635 m.222635 type:complete len:393 (-) comp10797_c0_seq1:820-1998(-)
MAEAEAPELPDLRFEEEVFDLCFHPGAPLIATGLITGLVSLHHYSPDDHVLRWQSTLHTDSCRAVAFNDDGSFLFTSSADTTLAALDVATGHVLCHFAGAHNAPINAMMNLPEAGLVATGDDEGLVKLWDIRQQTCAMEFPGHEDFIADFAYVGHKRTLLCAGGDGRLSVLNLRKNTRKASDQLEDELLSVVVVKDTRFVVCGTQEGILAIYKWGQWEDYVDRILGHPNSIDTIVALDESTICTGSSDGLIRVVGLYPNKLLGVIGDHDDFPVERIRLSGDRKLLGSCSHDRTVKFWNLDGLLEDDGREDEGEAMEADIADDRPAAAADDEDAEEDDDADDDDDEDGEDGEDDDDDDDDEDEDNGKPPSRALPARFQRHADGKKKNDFFDDL